MPEFTAASAALKCRSASCGIDESNPRKIELIHMIPGEILKVVFFIYCKGGKEKHVAVEQI